MMRLLSGLLAVISSSAVAAGLTAEVVYHHATIHTLDQTGTVAQALAISGRQDRLCWDGRRCQSS